LLQLKLLDQISVALPITSHLWCKLPSTGPNTWVLRRCPKKTTKWGSSGQFL